MYKVKPALRGLNVEQIALVHESVPAILEKAGIRVEDDETGLRDKVKTMVGGAVATDHWAKRIGADFFGETPQDTIDKLGKFLK